MTLQKLIKQQFWMTLLFIKNNNKNDAKFTLAGINDILSKYKSSLKENEYIFYKNGHNILKKLITEMK